MSFDSKRNIMLVTLILASMMIPIFGIRQNAAASGGSGHGKRALVHRCCRVPRSRLVDDKLKYMYE